jgi:hypothetical protein
LGDPRRSARLWDFASQISAVEGAHGGDVAGHDGAPRVTSNAPMLMRRWARACRFDCCTAQIVSSAQGVARCACVSKQMRKGTGSPRDAACTKILRKAALRALEERIEFCLAMLFARSALVLRE